MSQAVLSIPDSAPTATPAAKARLRRVYGYLRTPSVVPTSARRQMFQFTAREALERARQHVRIMDEVSREWHAVLRPFMGLWEPVVVSGSPLMFQTPGLARAAASGHPGGSDLYMGRSPVAPTLEAIRAAANPPRETCPPVSFDIDALDGGHDQKSAFAAWRV
jgi:hypothetical protein